MSSTDSYEALAESYRRLRIAAQAVLDAASYPTTDEEPRVYRSQLKALERELEGLPQPSAAKFAWMSIT